MSSLTDIIFLLLIFFMLTSTLVKIDAVDLPESDAKTVAPVSVAVSIARAGFYRVEGQEIPDSGLEEVLRERHAASGESTDFTLTIVAEKGTPFERVVRLLTLAQKLDVKTILATQAKKS